MNAYQLKAMQAAARIERRIFERLDERDMGALLWTDRYNAVRRIAFPGIDWLTYGSMLDSWMQTRAFEARF